MLFAPDRVLDKVSILCLAKHYFCWFYIVLVFSCQKWLHYLMSY